MIPRDLDADLAACEKASRVSDGGENSVRHWTQQPSFVATFKFQADVDFFILARTALPEYIAEVRRLRGELNAIYNNADAWNPKGGGGWRNQIDHEALAAIDAFDSQRDLTREEIHAMREWLEVTANAQLKAYGRMTKLREQLADAQATIDRQANTLAG